MKNRRVAAVILAGALLVPALIGAMQLTGWGSNSEPGGDSGRAMREFITALEEVGDQSFTVWYTTGDGVSVTGAQQPPRRAYRSAAGLYVAGPDATYLCRTPKGERASCGRAGGTDAVPLAHAKALSGVLEGQFVAPELALSYLSRLAARPPADLRRTERVIAGQPTRCIGVPKGFTACATTTGVLALFETPDARLTMTAYQSGAGDDLFALPLGAAITDTTMPS